MIALQRLTLAATLLASPFLAPTTQAAPAEGLTPWQASTLRSIASAAISPDGSHVAYTQATPRKPGIDEDGRARIELRVLTVATGESRSFITAESGASSISWTPDGSAIAFLAKRTGDEQRSLYTISIDGGEARKAFAFDDRGVGAYRISPDGKHVAVLATAPQPADQKAAAKKGFRPEVYEETWRPGEVWIAAHHGGEESEPRLLPIDGHVSNMEWAPDSRRLAVTVAPTALVDDSYTSKNVWIVDSVEGSVVGKILNHGKLGGYSWSPDGNWLALIAAFDEHDGSDARLLIGAAEGEAPPRPLLGERERDEEWVRWLADGRLLVKGSRGAWSLLDSYTLSGDKVSSRATHWPSEGPAISSVSVSGDGSQVAVVASSPTHPSELFTFDLKTGAMTRQTDSNPWLAEVDLARQEVIRYAARDGLEVEGILIHPLEGQKPAPLIVAVHGGPEAHISNGWLTRYSYAGQVGADKGYAVFYPNYRGSTGRGLGYLKTSQGDPAGKEFDDIVDGVRYLVEQGIADEARVGVTGGSYGGYATAWCSTYYSDVFAAGVMFVGISNKVSKVGTTDIADEEFLVHAMKRPWDDWMFFLERSPIFYADRQKTPLLIMHGKEDTRVDPGQSREMYRHLKLRGQAPVRLVNYPGEGHGNRNAGAQFDYMLRMLRWFDHYLMGDGGEPPAWPVDYEAHQPSEAEGE